METPNLPPTIEKVTNAIAQDYIDIGIEPAKVVVEDSVRWFITDETGKKRGFILYDPQWRDNKIVIVPLYRGIGTEKEMFVCFNAIMTFIGLQSDDGTVVFEILTKRFKRLCSNKKYLHSPGDGITYLIMSSAMLMLNGAILTDITP